MSVYKRRWYKFKSLKRGYISLIIIVLIYALSFTLPLFINSDALVVKYKGEYFFPVFKFYPSSVFGIAGNNEANYRELKKILKGDDYVIMPLYPYSPNENLLYEINGVPPQKPDGVHIFGTDDRGRDVFARVMYALNTSMSFSFLVTFLSFVLGVFLGALSGYFGGKTDITLQRIFEIWASLPFLYIIILVSSMLEPGFFSLALTMIFFNWIGITYYVRGEVLREKSKDYILAARSCGLSDRAIIMKHLLPNSMTPVITFAPFSIISNMGLLVALDFLGFGLQPPTPSWGQLIQQAVTNSIIDKWWLVVFPLSIQFIILLLIVFVGESLREAFDPKVYARYK